MVAVYVRLILKGLRTLEEVPALIYDAVKEELDKLGGGLDVKP